MKKFIVRSASKRHPDKVVKLEFPQATGARAEFYATLKNASLYCSIELYETQDDGLTPARMLASYDDHLQKQIMNRQMA